MEGLLNNLFEFFLYLPGIVPYLFAFLILLACGLGLPVPEDVTMFAMGLLSYYRLVDLKISIVVCFAGVIAGDCLVYFLGHHYGSRLTRKWFFAKLFTPERMTKTRKLFHRLGNKVILAARFMPGFRAATYFSAGTLHLPFKTFLFYDGLAAIISVPLLISTVYYFGDQVDRVILLIRRIQNGMGVVIFLIFLFFLIRHYWRKRKSARSTS